MFSPSINWPKPSIFSTESSSSTLSRYSLKIQFPMILQVLPPPQFLSFCPNSATSLTAHKQTTVQYMTLAKMTTGRLSFSIFSSFISLMNSVLSLSLKSTNKKLMNWLVSNFFIFKWLNLSMHSDIIFEVIVYFERIRGLMLERQTASQQRQLDAFELSNLALKEVFLCMYEYGEVGLHYRIYFSVYSSMDEMLDQLARDIISSMSWSLDGFRLGFEVMCNLV